MSGTAEGFLVPIVKSVTGHSRASVFLVFGCWNVPYSAGI